MALQLISNRAARRSKGRMKPFAVWGSKLVRFHSSALRPKWTQFPHSAAQNAAIQSSCGANALPPSTVFDLNSVRATANPFRQVVWLCGCHLR